VTPRELGDRLSSIHGEVLAWDSDALLAWTRSDVDDAVEAWTALDALITDLSILRRDAGIALARQLPDEYQTPTGTVVHRDLPKTEKWDGHGVLTGLAEPVITTDGEKVDAIRLEVVAKVLPACGQGATSSKWKISELRKALPDADSYREVAWGDPVIAKGPQAYQARRTKPPVVAGTQD
jgi:hypothetical protein